MSARRILSLVLVFGVAAVGFTAAIGFAPDLAARVEAGQWLGVALGLGVGLAFGLVLIVALMDQLAQDDARSRHDPMTLVQAFARRTMGFTDEQALAAATGEILAERLQVRTSGWLLIAPHDNAFAVRPVAGSGGAAAPPIEFSRQNVLLRQLGQRREPVRQSELERDAQYLQTPAAERQWLKQLGAEVYAPVFDAGLLIAILAVGPRDRGQSFQRAELDLVTLLTTQAAALLKAARLQAEVKALHDAIAQLNEKLLQKDIAVAKMDNSRGDFLAIASHELRTPITQLLGFADLLGAMAQDNSLDLPTVSQVTDNIVRACSRLNEVISQIMDMAQLDVNAMDLKFRETTLEGCLRQAIEPYVPALRERRLALKIVGLKDLPPITADEPRLVQAFSQLMSNAIKYTPDGGKIEVSLRLMPPDNHQPAQVHITFTDTGIGIDPQYHQLIFDKFYRIGSSAQHSTSTTRFMGAGPGLGLPIARGVIERHGGRIWVESDGHDPVKLPGSRFHIWLPLKPPAFDPRALEESGDRLRDGRTLIPHQSPFVQS